eukprot:2115579-Pleurochrysis_carterae.AAC.1
MPSAAAEAPPSLRLPFRCWFPCACVHAAPPPAALHAEFATLSRLGRRRRIDGQLMGRAR